MPALVTASRNHVLDALLELICIRIQLSATQDGAARQHYDAVTGWLSREGSSIRLFAPHIFPQGSQRLGTTTKPLRQSEFDLDAVCLLDIRQTSHPGGVYQLVWDQIASNDVYRPIMQRLPRCIRLNYSGDFHLDIVPAVPDANAGGKCILVPDLQANLAIDHPENDRWKVANPEGHSTWFEGRCVRPVALMEKYAMAKVDPVPETEAIHEKPALKRGLQLFKRWRDVEFKDRQPLSPPSIILTTLSGHLYQGEALCTDTLRQILGGIAEWIKSGRSMCLKNPAHDKEDICEKWERNPSSYLAFAASVIGFRDRWERLLVSRGLHEIEQELAELFEEAPVRWAVKKLAERRVVEPREKRVLGVQRRTGALGLGAAAGSGLLVRPNRFFGDAADAGQYDRDS